MFYSLDTVTIKIPNFEGPFDLLYHLIEKNKVNIYDIPINEITDQYMDYLFEMQKLDLEIASGFLVVAATLLHLKSKMLLPAKKKEKEEEEAEDPREGLVVKILEYKKYKDFAMVLKEREKLWDKVFYSSWRAPGLEWDEVPLELIPLDLKRAYEDMLERNQKKKNRNSGSITQIIQRERVSLRKKIREVIAAIAGRSKVLFSELFSFAASSTADVITGFIALLELARLKRVRLEQKRLFADITIYNKSVKKRSLNL